MVLFVKIVEEEESFDFTEDFYRSSVRQEDCGKPPLAVCCLVDFTDILASYPAFVCYNRRKIFVDKKR
jgi:hypothetical protein